MSQNCRITLYIVQNIFHNKCKKFNKMTTVKQDTKLRRTYSFDLLPLQNQTFIFDANVVLMDIKFTKLLFIY